MSDTPGLSVTCRAANLPALSFFGRGTAGVLSLGQGVFCEDFGQVLGASKVFYPNGDVTKNTTVLRTGGAGASLEVVPLSSCNDTTPLLCLEWTEAYVPTSAQTRSVYVKGGETGETWGAGNYPSNAQLYFEAEYISTTGFARVLAQSTEILTDDATWTALTLGFTPALAGHVRYRVWLKKYATSAKIYIDNQLQ